MGNLFSISLGLTEQQRQQVIPILKEELKQLEALKKDASLSGLRKIERLRETGVSFDEKLKPLINPDQHQKFQELREQLRRRLIAKTAGEAKEDIEATFGAWFSDKHGE